LPLSVSLRWLFTSIRAIEWVREWMSKLASVCDLASENFISSVTKGLQLWLSHKLVFNGNHVIIWVTISSRVAAINMKHSRDIYVLVGTAASEFAGNTHQAEFCALLGYHAAYSVKSLPMFWDKLSVPPSRVMKSKLFNPWRWDR